MRNDLFPPRNSWPCMLRIVTSTP